MTSVLTGPWVKPSLDLYGNAVREEAPLLGRQSAMSGETGL